MPISPINWCDLMHSINITYFGGYRQDCSKFTRVKETRIAKIIFKSKVRFTLLFLSEFDIEINEQNGESKQTDRNMSNWFCQKCKNRFKEEL